ncbi:MAG: XrtA-associated tyrosine autokinase [Nitrospirota bacterium]
MSRIEKSLQKALEVRESVKNTIDEKMVITEDRQDFTLPKFEIGESIIKIDTVDKHIICLTDPFSPAAEQYKKLHVRIFRSTVKDFINTIMITSPGVGEGKTITATNLAVSMANEIDHTVLLVDADLKHPSIHKYLGIESKYGLSDYLMGKVKLQDILIKTGVGKLVFLPAGTSAENTTELMSSQRMKRLVYELKHRYKDRYIIFDSPPLLVTADSLSMCSYMDGIVFVIQASKTTQKAALHAVSLIKGHNILGVVFNNVPKDFAKNLYPYYYESEKYYKRAKNNKETE